jgi:hypothetical protein
VCLFAGDIDGVLGALPQFRSTGVRGIESGATELADVGLEGIDTLAEIANIVLEFRSVNGLGGCHECWSLCMG